jgi:hypothetical protein
MCAPHWSAVMGGHRLPVRQSQTGTRQQSSAGGCSPDKDLVKPLTVGSRLGISSSQGKLKFGHQERREARETYNGRVETAATAAHDCLSLWSLLSILQGRALYPDPLSLQLTWTFFSPEVLRLECHIILKTDNDKK